MAETTPTLQHLIPKLHVLSREFTGVGSYTKFLSSASVPDLGDKMIDLHALINMPGVAHGMGAILFCEAGKLKTLETYTHGTAHWNGNFDGFSIAEAG